MQCQFPLHCKVEEKPIPVLRTNYDPFKSKTFQHFDPETAKPGKQSQTDDVVKLLLRQVESGEHVQPELIEAVLKQKFKLDQKVSSCDVLV